MPALSFALFAGNFDSALSYSEDQLKISRDLIGYLKVRAGFEQQHANSLTELWQKLRDKYVRILDEMAASQPAKRGGSFRRNQVVHKGLSSTMEAWLTLADASGAEAQLHHQQATKLNDLAHNFEVEVKECEKARIKLVYREKMMEGDKELAMQRVAKAKFEYWNAVTKAKAAAAAGDKKTAAALDKDASLALKTYEAAVKAGNAEVKKYYQDEMPTLLSEYEKLEARRGAVLSQVLKATMNEIDKGGTPRSVTEKAIARVGKIDPQMDIKQFVEINTKGTTRKTGIIATTLKVEKEIPASFQPSVFGTTIGDIMKHQAAQGLRSEVPQIVLACLAAVERLDGVNTEGIFRLSADSSEVGRLRSAFDTGNYSIDSVTDPHVPAHLLKQWLRSLTEPVVPFAAYPAALKAAVAAVETGQATGVVTIINKLPPVNRMIIERIIGTLRKIAANDKVSKMGPDNLAIVFGPCFLRSPSKDPLETLASLDKEMVFVEVLLRHASGGVGGALIHEIKGAGKSDAGRSDAGAIHGTLGSAVSTGGGGSTRAASIADDGSMAPPRQFINKPKPSFSASSSGRSAGGRSNRGPPPAAPRRGRGTSPSKNSRGRRAPSPSKPRG